MKNIEEVMYRWNLVKEYVYDRVRWRSLVESETHFPKKTQNEEINNNIDNKSKVQTSFLNISEQKDNIYGQVSRLTNVSPLLVLFGHCFARKVLLHNFFL